MRWVEKLEKQYILMFYCLVIRRAACQLETNEIISGKYKCSFFDSLYFQIQATILPIQYIFKQILQYCLLI